MSWIVIVAVYAAVGALFVFVGPAAGALRREQMVFLTDAAWKEWAFLAAIATGIVLLWPVLVPSARRSNAGRGERRLASRIRVLSEAGRLQVEEARRTGPRVLSLDEVAQATTANFFRLFLK